MGRGLAVVALAVLGVFCAAGMGYAAYVVSRGSVAVPVTRLQRTPPANLTPARLRQRAVPKTTSSPRTTTTTLTQPATTADDHGGRGRGGGSGGGGHGSDD